MLGTHSGGPQALSRSPGYRGPCWPRLLVPHPPPSLALPGLCACLLPLPRPAGAPRHSGHCIPPSYSHRASDANWSRPSCAGTLRGPPAHAGERGPPGALRAAPAHSMLSQPLPPHGLPAIPGTPDAQPGPGVPLRHMPPRLGSRSASPGASSLCLEPALPLFCRPCHEMNE